MPGVKLTKFVEKMNLKNCTPEIDLNGKYITLPDVNRPALQLTGYYEHFDSERVQIIGIVESTYLGTFSEERKKDIYKELLSYNIPCLILTSQIRPEEELLRRAKETGTPILTTEKKTSPFQAEVIRWLNVQLAPCISIHGVLVDVYGVGVLIRGESGIGKSELALELIKRGHRLVTDDAVEIRKVSDDTLVGCAPSITKHLIELRGIGIIDIKSLYGVQSVKETQNIDLVITLEEWEKGKEYDRLGLEDEYTEFLGNKVKCHTIPIRPGRNLAVNVEATSINHRQTQMDYIEAQELYRRLQKSLTQESEEEIEW